MRLLPWLSLALGLAGPVAAQSSVRFVQNAPNAHEYALQTTIPAGFGEGEFTLELWIRPDDSFPVGSTAGGPQQLVNWSDDDQTPYSSGSWWFEGNFLLDGHNNASFKDGTFSLQFYGGGRLRWLFGDGQFPGQGANWSVGVHPATNTPSLLDGAWHHVTCVRRWQGTTASRLELWVDGALVATETSNLRTDMRTFWDTWAGFPGGQEGWFWGAEKQAAIGLLSQYEDYKGLVDELRFWSRAKSASEIATTWDAPVLGSEEGLVGWFTFDEGAGPEVCDSVGPTCADLLAYASPAFDADEPPLDSPFARFCAGDGAVAGCGLCPCGNVAPTGTESGCLNSSGAGARLAVGGYASLAGGGLRFELEGASPSSFALLVSAQNLLPAAGACPLGSGIPSAVMDGLRCVGGDFRRQGTRATDAQGDVGKSNAGWGPPDGPVGGVLAHAGAAVGTSRRFQCFYRDDPMSVCGRGQNTSDAVSVTVLP